MFEEQSWRLTTMCYPLLLIGLTAVLLPAARPASSGRAQPSAPEFKSGTVRANGLTFAYIEAGEGPLVIALHGFPDQPRTFRYQIQALAAAGYHVIAPFARGYAPTDVPPDGPYESAALVADALALIDALGRGRPVILMGHDWGAVAAHGAAAIAPEKIAKLITIAVPHGLFTQSLVTNPTQQRRSWYMYFFQTAFAEQAVERDNYAFLDRLWQEWSPGWRYPTAEMDSVKTMMGRPGVLRAALRYYRDTLDPRYRVPALDSIRAQQNAPIRVPTLYVHGADDGCIGVEVSEGVERGFTGRFEKRVIPNAGHFPHQERPEEFNSLLLTFLQ
jgi:pimeloyl-ACP methyl ester carboxylesterase